MVFLPIISRTRRFAREKEIGRKGRIGLPIAPAAPLRYTEIMEDTEKKIEKKYPCPDCDFCQWCSTDRCNLCRKLTGCKDSCKKKKKGHQPLFRSY